MNLITTYIIPILEFLLVLGELAMLFKKDNSPREIRTRDTYHIQVNHYHRSEQVSHQSETGCFVILALFFSYIIYSWFQSYFILIILSLNLLKIIRYSHLKINYKNDLIVSNFIVSLIYTFNFLPKEVKEFWKTNTKVNLGQISGLSALLDELAKPLKEMIELVFKWYEHPIRNMSILGTIFFVLASLFYLLNNLFTPKDKLNSLSRQSLTSWIIFFLLLYGLVFYHIEWNPIRLIINFIER